MQQLCNLEQLTNHHSKGFVVAGQSLFLVRKNDQVYAYLNRCPHLGIELNWQEDGFLTFEKELIQCSTHGALFTIDRGQCVAGPCSGQKLTALATRIEQGAVWVDIPDKASE